MNRRLAATGIIATSLYFSLAYYFKVSFVEEVPRRADVVAIPRILKSGLPGTFYAHLWLPTYVTRATIYEDGVPIGNANTIYDDPGRTWIFEGRRWKFVEFNSSGDPARRWIVFGTGSPTSELR